MNSQSYSPGEVAAMAGICTKTVRRAILAGELAALRYNSRTLRITRSDLEAWQVRCRVRAMSPAGATHPKKDLSA